MAFEFVAPISAKTVPFAVLAESLQTTGVCLIEVVSPVGALLRWPDTRRRAQWPEDAELSMSEDGLLLTIHSGTQQQKKCLIDAVAIIAAEVIGESVNFEEA